ncbi:alpha-tocopherol transfer protein-like [Argiope bruennichi]|uniref:alpha-tocopherol transfer protein-like n=1 Tax=Argiope bruennichi TaxID=94029 RepID=UPI0024955AF5|nr:alpha-tocopherol transfer protein-like [Argiope bruennichi]XP_055945264.1 alpha-tocopherol transfer protein-like [Argiope bruennichi]XP_055945265.1 alpha-tocopherol transfer protein-like [Argiope bruennichi]XP_055945266.1 alpha-tocopherol transfer protein-like [Argiope bruennichi]
MDEATAIVVGNKIHRPLLDETLTTEDLRVAREELNETAETREVALRVLKKMLAEQNEFMPRTDDVYLLRFLRCRKFDCERALKTIRDHYKFRKQHRDIFPLPSSIEKALRAHIFNFLPHRDQKGRAIYVVRMARWIPEETSYADFVAAGNLIAEYVLDNPVTQINGYIGIWDFKGFSIRHFLPFCSPKHIILLTTLMQDRFPARFKIAYCVNCSSLVNKAWALISPVMKDKFRKRIKIFGTDMTVLHQFLEPAILPTEYGGIITTPENVEMAQRVLDQEQYVKFNLKFGFP